MATPVTVYMHAPFIGEQHNDVHTSLMALVSILHFYLAIWETEPSIKVIVSPLNPQLKMRVQRSYATLALARSA